MKRFSGRRFAALLLAFTLAASSFLPAAAAAMPPAESVPFTEIAPPEDAAAPPYHQLTSDEPQAMSDAISDEPLRVLIELEKPSLLEMNYDAADVAGDGEAAAYNKELEQYQADVIAAIGAAIDEPLDVVWRFTIVADLLSVRVRPAQMEIIAAVPGVRSVQEDAVVVPMEAESVEAENEVADGGETSGEADDANVDGDEPGGGAANGEEIGGEADDAEPGTDEPDGTEPDGGAVNGDETGGGADDAEPGGSEPDGVGPDSAETFGDGPATIAESDAPAAIAEVGVTPDYTGAGQRIAIIDTGVDEWHRSLNSGAWMYSLQQNEAFTPVSSLDLLDKDDIARVLDDLTVMQRHPELLDDPAARAATAAELAGHGDAVTVGGQTLHKIAFGANYVDDDYANIAHAMEAHGSHVAGIAAANRYLPDKADWDPDSGQLLPGVDPDKVNYVELPEVMVDPEDDGDDEDDEDDKDDEEITATVVGQAPDAQLLVMQVFNMIITHESDYMAAVQDALILGADVINLSLGSSIPGATFSTTPLFQSIVNELTEHGVVVAAAHGNSYYLTHSNLSAGEGSNGLPELPYEDDVNFYTGGTPLHL